MQKDKLDTELLTTIFSDQWDRFIKNPQGDVLLHKLGGCKEFHELSHQILEKLHKEGADGCQISLLLMAIGVRCGLEYREFQRGALELEGMFKCSPDASKLLGEVENAEG